MEGTFTLPPASTATFTSTTTPTASPVLTPPAPNISTTPSIADNVSMEVNACKGISRSSTLYSVASSLISNGDISKSVAKRWYEWSKSEPKKDNKVLWYMKPTETNSNVLKVEPTSSTISMTKVDEQRTKTSDVSDIVVTPSFQLRSTTIHNSPRDERVPSTTQESTDTDVSNFKYYCPENRSKQTVGKHTKATMYKMNTHLKQMPCSIGLSTITATNSNDVTNTIKDSSSSSVFISRGVQTDLETQLIGKSSSQVRYLEKQQSQIIPQSVFSKYDLRDTGLYHLSRIDLSSQPVLPPIENTPVWSNDQLYPSDLVNPLTAPSSILKKPSTVLSRETSNPLSEQTHDKVLEELRKRNKNAKNGTYRVKKVHLLEKIDPPTVSFDLPSLPSTKANQSISRSERLFSSQLLNRKK